MGKITIHLLFVFFYCLTVSSQTFQDKWVSIGGNTQKDKTVVYEVLELAYYDSVTDFIQAKTFTIDSYYEHSPLVIG